MKKPKMKKLEMKTKISTITLILLLTLSAILVVLPAVNAQVGPIELIMNNSGNYVIYGNKMDIDLNGNTGGQLVGLKFAYIPPGGTEWVITTEPIIDNEPGLPGERYVTDAGGDCDIDWIPSDGMGDYQIKWIHPASGSESQVEIIEAGPPPHKTTYPFIGVIPDPVGVNQPILIHVGIFQQLSNVAMGWQGLSIEITKPDAETDTISDIKTDSTGGTGRTYTPTQVGTYTLTLHFPEQAVVEDVNEAPGVGVGTIMDASSATVELEVLADAIPYYPGHSLPSEYWTRPIDAQLREWALVTGNWIHSAGSSTPIVLEGNADAPDSAHILWTKPLLLGGIAGMMGVTNPDVGAQDGPQWSYSHGDAYQGKWNSRIIINGILIYTDQTSGSYNPRYYTALDVRTGEELWRKVIMDNRSISFAQNIRWGGYNQHAVYSYFWVTIGSDWHAFDPLTGDWRWTVENVPSGTTLFDENGWLYRVNTGQGYIWSMTLLTSPITETGSSGGTFDPGSGPDTYDAAATSGSRGRAAEAAYITEFEWPSGLPNQRAIAWGDKAFGLRYSQTEIRTWAVSLEPGLEGTLLYDKTWAAPAWWEEGDIQIEFNTISLEDDAAVFWIHDTLEYYCFSTDTGDYKWGPAEPEFYANYYGWTEFGERPPMIWNGMLYSSGVGGVIYCYDLDDGSVLWSYDADDPYQEYLFSNNWWQFFLFITDGKLYSAHMEHSAIEPMPRGAPFLCLNATSGDLIWRADGLFRSSRWGDRGIIGDSVMVGMDTYDNRLYAVGKGPSTTTVLIQSDVITHGNSAMVKGTVMDVSPGTEDIKLRLRFPKGVPAISDASMSDWMLHVYKQFERPTDAYGVTVKIEAYDPNGNYQNFGTTTSDANGNYGFEFEPEVPGTYWISATFEGSNSYYGSTASTYLTVDPADPEIVIPPYPTYPGYQGPSASEVAQNVIANLPEDATPAEIAQAVEDQLDLPEPTETPEYTTMDIILIILVAVSIVLSVVILLKKRQ